MFFRWLAYKSLLGEFQCFIMNYTMWSFNLFFFFFCIQLFPTFFMSKVFQGPGFSVWVQGPGPGSESRCQKQPMQNNFIIITFLHGCFPVNLLHIFRTVSHKITSGGLLLNMGTNKRDKVDRKIQCNRNYVNSLFGIFISFQCCSY